MKGQIIDNIERLSLHDSHIEKIERSAGKMVLTLDWAKLNDYSESNIQEGIIIGKCKLTLNGFNSERLILNFEGIPGKENLKPEIIKYDSQLQDNWLILENKLISKDRYCLSGLFEFNHSSAWLNWEFSFSDFQFNWNDSISWKDWQKGKLVRE